MANFTQTQRGNTCQYFCLLYLMEEGGMGALTQSDFTNFITYVVNRSPNSSGFISNYLKKSKNNSVFITNINNLTNGQRYYVDNSIHAVVMTKTAPNTFDVWNPQLNTVESLSNTSGKLTTNTAPNQQEYPDGTKTAVDVWELDASKVQNNTATNTERDRQITIINNLVSYLKGNSVTATNVDTPIASMKPDEIKAFASAIVNTFKLNVKAVKEKLAIA